MTSAQTMLKEPRRGIRPAGFPRLGLLGVLVSAILLAGCAQRPALVPPGVVVSPYAADAAIAVIPLRNESGASFLDADAQTDKVIAALSQVRGLTCLPLNRTIEAMRALELPAVVSPIQAQQVAQAMGVDGVVVGTITAYDPYDPPVFGLSLALFAQPSLGGNGGGPLSDPRLLSFQATDAGYTGASSNEPMSSSSSKLECGPTRSSFTLVKPSSVVAFLL